MRRSLLHVLGGIGAGLGVAAALALATTAWSRCADIGPAVQVHPAIRAWDASARPRD